MTLILAATLITACSKEARKARLLGEADNYFKAGNYDKAKLSYINVLQLDPQTALAFARNAPARRGAPSSCHIVPILSNASAFF